MIQRVIARKKVYWICHAFEVEHYSLQTKNKYFLLSDHQLSENLIFVFGFYERIKSDKSELVVKFVAISVTMFSY